MQSRLSIKHMLLTLLCRNFSCIPERRIYFSKKKWKRQMALISYYKKGFWKLKSRKKRIGQTALMDSSKRPRTPQECWQKRSWLRTHANLHRIGECSVFFLCPRSKLMCFLFLLLNASHVVSINCTSKVSVAHILQQAPVYSCPKLIIPSPHCTEVVYIWKSLLRTK